MEIEVNISFSAIRIRQKIQKYALRITSFENINSIRIKTPIIYPLKYSNKFDNFNMNKFVN